MPKVSIVIPVHNRERYVGAAIDSALNQTFTDFELLIIDDGSTDRSLARVAAYEDPRLRVLRNERNLGIPATRNRAVACARGEYLAFLDSDDWAHPERLARQAAFLDRHSDYAAVGAWIEWMDAAGKPTGKVKRKATKADQVAAERLFRAGLENTTVMARTRILRDYPHRTEFALGSDYDLWARLAAVYPLTNLPMVLARRRQHTGRTTARFSDAHAKAWRLEIFAWQLRALGLGFTDSDLDRHYLLRRMHKLGFTPDSDFLDWAENWLVALRSANRARGLYPEPAFSGVLGGFWFKTCWNAESAASPWRRFRRSALYRPACSGALRLASMRMGAAFSS